MKCTRSLASALAMRAFFPLPSLTDARGLVRIVRSSASRLEAHVEEKLLARAPGLRSRAFEADSREKAKALCAPLASLSERDVEEVVFEKHGLKDDRVVTCMVPYQLAANIILSRLPWEIRDQSIAELKAEEETLKVTGGKGIKRSGNQWIGWFEQDLYVGDGLRYLERIDTRKKNRVPIFTVMGHVNHGKTTLLDALQASNVLETEAHGITQTVRAFTTAHPTRQRELFTFVDVPGHKVFVESRYHAQRLADCILLVLSVTEGLQSQTHEAVKIALNLDKPIIVVLNKVDQLSDPFTAQQRVRAILCELGNIGLDVTLVEKESDIDSAEEEAATSAPPPPPPPPPTCAAGGHGSSRASGAPAPATEGPRAWSSAETCLLPVKRMDPTYKGNSFRPVLDLHRKCYGVCISAAHRVNLPTLWRLMCLWRDTVGPSCLSTSASSNEHNAAVQAVVLESSKHLFDEEGFRQSNARQRIQRGLDRSQDRHSSQRGSMSASAKMNASLTAGFRQYKKRNRTSTQSLVITTIVREGVLRRGMHFVVDQAEGRADYLLDYWGNFVEAALPGMAVTIVDADSSSGCPGPGTHVLSVTDEKTQLNIYGFRRMLQWYAELFPEKLHLLKPRGMDVRFAHLGDYGQLGVTHTLEYQLLYGPPPPSPPPPAPALSAPPSSTSASLPFYPEREGGSDGDAVDSSEIRSIGEYLAELNAADEAKTRVLESGVTAAVATLSGAAAAASGSLTSMVRGPGSDGRLQAPVPKRVGQGLFSPGEEETLEHTWRAFQPTEKMTSAAEYERHLRQCVQVGVLIKVDNYHTARMLVREIPRLGAKKVAFQVVGARFGPLTVEDIAFFAQTVKVIICYRNPYAPSSELDHYIEINDQWVLHTDHFADIIAFLKWCAVATQKEFYANAGKMTDKRLCIPGAEADSSTEDEDDGISGELDAADQSAGGNDDSSSHGSRKRNAKAPRKDPSAAPRRKKKLLLTRTESE